MAQPTTDRSGGFDMAEPHVATGGGGANDSTSGGGAGSGVPDGDTALRAGQTLARDTADADRAKLFPESASSDRPTADIEWADDQDNDIPVGAMPPPKGG